MMAELSDELNSQLDGLDEKYGGPGEEWYAEVVVAIDLICEALGLMGRKPTRVQWVLKARYGSFR